MALIRCPECGKKVSDQAPACPHCGNPNVAAPAAKNPEETPAPAPKERRSHKKAILVVSVVLVLCLAAGGVWAAAKWPMISAQKKLQSEWYRSLTTSSNVWLTFLPTGIGEAGIAVYEVDSGSRPPRRLFNSTHPYKLLSPTELKIDDTIHTIQFNQDGTLSMSPAFFTAELWYSPLTHPTPTPRSY